MVAPLTFRELRKVWYVPLHVRLSCKIYDLNNPHNSSKKRLYSLFPDINSWAKTFSSAFCESMIFLHIIYYRCKDSVGMGLARIVLDFENFRLE